MKIPANIQSALLSYARVFMAAALTLYLAGERDLSAMWAAGVASVLPPLVRWLNPNDHAFDATEDM